MGQGGGKEEMSKDVTRLWQSSCDKEMINEYFAPI